MFDPGKICMHDVFLIHVNLRLTLILSNTCLHSVVYQVILREHLFSLLERKVFQIVFILLPIGDK